MLLPPPEPPELPAIALKGDVPLREPPPPPPFAVNVLPAIVIEELNPFCPFVPAVLFPTPPFPTLTVIEVPAAIL